MPLPIDDVLPAILAALETNTRVVIEAPPGAGKTTRVPPALLDAAWLGEKKILLLEPRRIAARAAAEFIARERGEAVGATVGYRIRFESRTSAATRIEVVTEGILTRMIQDDPELAGIGAILFDEFHERHLHGDLGAALALDVQASLRPDLRLAIMSATLEGNRIRRWFDAAHVESEGRSFAVSVKHPAARAEEQWPARGWLRHVRRAVELALAENDGDVLVFLPGRREIERVGDILQSNLGADAPAFDVAVLHGDLSVGEQHAVLASVAGAPRRVVLATNVAESSLTLPGVRAVVDLGLAREPRFDPNSGFTRLATVAIAQASADQRAGRAGRLGPGACYQLWPQSRRLEPSRRPEIAQIELSPLALELSAWGSTTLDWLDAPPPGALAQAHELLRALGALDAVGRITARGRAMLGVGSEPRLAAMLLAARNDDERELACTVAALIEARDPLRGDARRSDDFRARLHALDAWRRNDRRAHTDVDGGVLANVARAAALSRQRLTTALDNRSQSATNATVAATVVGRKATVATAVASTAVDRPTAVGNILLHAFPDRIARKDVDDPRRYRLANGRGARLGADSALVGEAWLCIVDLAYDARDSLIRSAAPFDEERLHADFESLFVRERVVRWNDELARIDAFEEQRFGAIVLVRHAVPVEPDEAVPALIDAIRAHGIDTLPWRDAARTLRARVQALRGWMPDLDLPDLSDTSLLASLEHWLAPSLVGKRRLDALSADELGDALAAQLDYVQRRALDKHAPAAITVPSGLSRRIVYDTDAGPVLAVKLQELFGLADTPRIADGRIALTLHLLSPGGKPLQVTQDLCGFWERTYPEVRKEMKGRYPKHPWPDDPWTAAPTHRSKPRL